MKGSVFFKLVLICFVLKAIPVSSQTPLEKRLLHHLMQGHASEMSRIIDSARYNVRKPSFQDFSLFDISMLQDNTEMFAVMLDRAQPVAVDDLTIAGWSGKRDYFLELLSRSGFTDCSDYYFAATLLNPLSTSGRKELAAIFSDESYDWRKEIYMEEYEIGPTDMVALQKLQTYLESRFPATDVTTTLGKLGMEGKIYRPSAGASHLFDIYAFQDKELLNHGFEDRYFYDAFHRSDWLMVDFFLLAGFKPHLSEIRPFLVDDPYQAIGYFVTQQLLDLKGPKDGLKANRSWKAPLTRVVIPQIGKEPLKITGDTEQFNGILMNGAVSQPVALNLSDLSAGTERFFRVRCHVNLKLNEIFVPWNSSYSVFIPPSDPASGGEYGGVKIINNGNGFEGYNNATAPVEIYSRTTLIDKIYPGDESVITRAKGEVEIRGKFTPVETFGIEVVYLQQSHDGRRGDDVRSRLETYKLLVQEAEIKGNLQNGEPYTSDSAIRIQLYSRQLLETAPPVIKGELASAMQNLAMQSDFSAGFSNFLYEEFLGNEADAALEPFLTSSDATIRNQAMQLRDAVNRRREALQLLDSENVRNYIIGIKKVKMLLFELAQYYEKDELLRNLDDVLKNLNTANRNRFLLNIKNSKEILDVKDTDLEGKGAIIRAHLKL